MTPSRSGMPAVHLSIIIVTYNVSGLLRTCLRSLQRTVRGTTYEVIVVDNASSDGTTQMLAREFATTSVIANDANVGFCVANNQGIARASGEYVMLLNADTEVQPGAVSQMLDYLSAHPDVWALGPDLPQPLDPIDVLTCGWQPTLRRAFNQYFFLAALRPRDPACQGIQLYRRGGYSSATQVEWISGACILTRSSVLAKVGGLDESIFLYTDDFEWCHRVVQAGGKIVYLPTAVVTHFAGSSTRKSHYRVFWTQSWLDYFRRINGPTRTIPFGLIVGLGSGMRAVRAALRLLVTWDGRYLRAARWHLEVAVLTLIQLPKVLTRARGRPTRVEERR